MTGRGAGSGGVIYVFEGCLAGVGSLFRHGKTLHGWLVGWVAKKTPDPCRLNPLKDQSQRGDRLQPHAPASAQGCPGERNSPARPPAFRRDRG